MVCLFIIIEGFADDMDAYHNIVFSKQQNENYTYLPRAFRHWKYLDNSTKLEVVAQRLLRVYLLKCSYIYLHKQHSGFFCPLLYIGPKLLLFFFFLN